MAHRMEAEHRPRSLQMVAAQLQLRHGVHCMAKTLAQFANERQPPECRAAGTPPSQALHAADPTSGRRRAHRSRPGTSRTGRQAPWTATRTGPSSCAPRRTARCCSPAPSTCIPRSACMVAGRSAACMTSWDWQQTLHLHVGDLVEDGPVRLGVQLGVLLAVRQQLREVQHEMPVPAAALVRGWNDQHLLRCSGAKLVRDRYRWMIPREDRRSTFSLFFHSGPLSVFATLAACASPAAGSAASAGICGAAFLFTILPFAGPRGPDHLAVLLAQPATQLRYRECMYKDVE